MTTRVYKVRSDSDGDCECGPICKAALGGDVGECPRDYSEPQLVDLATREPVEHEYAVARETLATAAEYVAGPRSRYYGHPLDNHGRTAKLWRAYFLARFGVDLAIVEEDVCWLNVQQKIAREMNAPSDDGPVDVCGYGANVPEIRAERERRARPCAG